MKKQFADKNPDQEDWERKQPTKKEVETKLMNLSDIMGGNNDTFVITENNIYLEGMIDEDSAKEITSFIIEANFPPEGEPPITHINLFINSLGGDLDATFSMISVIEASEIPITTIAIGSCASGGLMTAISGHTRLVDKYCSIMSHTLSTGFGDMAKPADLHEWMKSVEMAAAKIEELYKDKTNLEVDFIREHMLPGKSDVYLTAKEALDFKLFDGYFTSFKQLKG